MAVQLDHMILNVNDRAGAVGFYTGVLGLADEGEDGPFAVIRVSPSFILLLAEWPTGGGGHLAFAMSRAEFDAVFARLVDSKLAYGDRFDTVGNMKGPGEERGAGGGGASLYFFDPSKHLIEIKHYEAMG